MSEESKFSVQGGKPFSKKGIIKPKSAKVHIYLPKFKRIERIEAILKLDGKEVKATPVTDFQRVSENSDFWKASATFNELRPATNYTCTFEANDSYEVQTCSIDVDTPPEFPESWYDHNNGKFVYNPVSGDINDTYVIINKTWRHPISSSGRIKLLRTSSPDSIDRDFFLSLTRGMTLTDINSEVAVITDFGNSICLARNPYKATDGTTHFRNSNMFIMETNLALPKCPYKKDAPSKVIAIRDIDTGDEDIRYDTD